MKTNRITPWFFSNYFYADCDNYYVLLKALLTLGNCISISFGLSAINWKCEVGIKYSVAIQSIIKCGDKRNCRFQVSVMTKYHTRWLLKKLWYCLPGQTTRVWLVIIFYIILSDYKDQFRFICVRPFSIGTWWLQLKSFDQMALKFLQMYSSCLQQDKQLLKL